MKTVLRAPVLSGLVFLGCLCLLQPASARAAQTSDPLIVRTHFIGTTRLFGDPAGAGLKAMWNLPGTIAFRDKAVDRFAQLMPQLFQPQAAANPGGQALWRPLLDDVLAYESHAEFAATPEMVLAVRLPEARAKAWDASLRQALAGGKPVNTTAATGDGIAGWEVKQAQAPQLIRFGRAGEWTVLTCGPGKLSLAQRLVTTLTKKENSSGAWLEGDANLARFDRVFPVLADFQSLPMAHFSLSNRADFVRTLVNLDFAKPHGWKAEPWRIPTNNIFDPLISFTAVRGVAPVLDSIPAIRQIGWSPTPSQISGWGLRQLPFQFIYATPTRDITNQLKQIAPRLQSALFSKQTNLVGRIVVATNQGSIYWEGLPLAVPRLAPLRGEPGFMAFEMFPLAASKTRPPPELFQQLARDNLVYYDWEITQDRIPSWRQLYQLAEIATLRHLTPTNASSDRFITDISTRLGECVTEIAATSPTQLTLVRKSHLGLSSFEIVTLSRWIESTSFPAFGVFLPPTKPSTRPPAAKPPKR